MDEIIQITNGLVRPAKLTWSHIHQLFDRPINQHTYKKIQITDWSDRNLKEVLKLDKQHAVIRRLRLGSIIYRCPSAKYLVEEYSHLGYPFLCNLAIYRELWGDDAIQHLYQLGLFNDVTTFAEHASDISAYVKGFGPPSHIKDQLAELPALMGFMLHSEQFNLLSEARELSTPGNFTFPVDRQLWRDTIVRHTPPPRLKRDYVTFEDYIRSGVWITSGSCSIGHVDWEFDDSHGRVKARKNTLTIIYPMDEIVSIVLNWDGHIRNRAIIKNELGKIRLAIASNLESYIHESYILDCYGHGYVNWDWITLDESQQKAFDRTCDVSETLSNNWVAMPWDFKGFDRQPTTLEIQEILWYLIAPIATADRPDIGAVLNRVIKSYSLATLECPVNGKNVTINVAGGLQSGQRTTSLIGNLWNRYRTKMAYIRASEILGYNPNLKIGLRGDDSYVLAASYMELYALRLGYGMVNAIGHNKKFSIRPSSVEFLRTEIGPDYVKAWPNRAIPSVTQRKPWSNDVFDPANEVGIVSSNICNVERRSGITLHNIHNSNSTQWSKFTRQSTLWLHLPKRLGGYGLYPWKGWVPNGRLPPISPPTPTYKTPLKGNYPSYLEALGYGEAYLRGAMSVNTPVHMIPGMCGKLAHMVRQAYSRVRFTWSKVSTLPPVPINSNLLSLPVRNCEWPKRDPVIYKPRHLNYPTPMQFIRDYNYVRRGGIKLPSLGSMLRDEYPAFYNDLRRLERRGFHRTDAITILTGSTPTEPVTTLNSELVVWISDFVYRVLTSTGVKGRERIAKTIYSATRTAVSTIHNTTTCMRYLF